MLPLSSKQIATVIGVLCVVVLHVWLVSKVKDKIEDSITNNKLVDEANAEIDVNKTTLTQSQLNTLSTKIYSALKGAGSDEDAVYAAIEEVQNRTDLLQLIKTFGVKNSLTMKEWLYDDLSVDEIAHINNILASKNINYVF